MNYGLNYMGSKNTIAPLIVQYVISSHPDKKYFIDACCGGFAISHYVIRETNMTVYANDLNPYIMDLFNILFTDGGKEFDKVADAWISRARYMDVRDHPEKYAPWFVGYVLTNWSFGGRGDGYLYAKEKEPEKKAIHDALVFNKWDGMPEDFVKQLPREFLDGYNPSNPAKRRALLLLYENAIGKQVQLENQSRLERLLTLRDDISPKCDRVHLSVSDYRAFIESLPKEILDNSVIYFDPPYEDTATYYTNDINYTAFWDFVEGLRIHAPVYVSSYTAPERFKEVWNAKKRINLDNPTNREFTRHHRIERLFYNGYANKESLLGDLLGF